MFQSFPSRSDRTWPRHRRRHSEISADHPDSNRSIETRRIPIMASETEQTQDEGRRDFLKGALAAGGAAATWAAAGLSSVTNAQAQPGPVPGTRNHYYVPATDKTVHWGYFSKLLKPQVEVNSGDFVTIEALTHHANDDAERMIKGDPG